MAEEETRGRPTVYDEKYPAMLIAHMASGLSYESFAGVISVNRDTLYNWEKVHPLFFDAKKTGSAKNLLFWEKAGHEGLFEKTEYNEDGKPVSKRTLNSTVWIFSMKNRHKWADRQEVAVDATVTTTPLKADLEQKSSAELLQILAKTKKTDDDTA